MIEKNDRALLKYYGEIIRKATDANSIFLCTVRDEYANTLYSHNPDTPDDYYVSGLVTAVEAVIKSKSLGINILLYEKLDNGNIRTEMGEYRLVSNG